MSSSEPQVSLFRSSDVVISLGLRISSRDQPVVLSVAHVGLKGLR